MLSDSGSQLVAGGNVIQDFLKTQDAQQFFKQHSINSIKFQHYFKGNHELGSIVGTAVKMVKRLIFGSIKTNILSLNDFHFFVKQTIHLVNKRPIAFKESLRNDKEIDIFDPITPEILLKGFELPSINIVPDLQRDPDDEWLPQIDHISNIRANYDKLNKVRNNLCDLYHNEFLTTLITQATDRKGRYRPVSHMPLSPGDIVLLKEPLMKSYTYPMAIVKKVQVNDINEVTGVSVFKGKTRETVERHITSIIPLLKASLEEVELDQPKTKTFPQPLQSLDDKVQNNSERIKPKRSAAIRCNEKLNRLAINDDI